jgi:N-carbamoyl-L-amino-acid hydrolase
VEGIVGIAWSRLTLSGVQDHAGPTPMRIRHDALVAAADVVRAVRAIPGQLSAQMVATVGRLEVSPNITNAIPGRVFLSVDIRDPKDEQLTRALTLLTQAVKDAAAREGVSHELEHYWRVPPTSFHPEVVDVVERAAQSVGSRYRRIRSGAGHDAQYMAAICPAGMIFVPSRNGRSHCEEEFTAWEEIEHGANVLLTASLELAQEA